MIINVILLFLFGACIGAFGLSLIWMWNSNCEIKRKLAEQEEQNRLAEARENRTKAETK